MIRLSNSWLRLEVIALLLALFYPIADYFNLVGSSLGNELNVIFTYCILALGLNVVVGFTGLLHLGIAAFFGIGAYLTGIVTVTAYPFQWSFLPALVLAVAGAAAAGLLLGAPTLRLRGDYLAIVTLGFGEVVRFSLKNFEEITNGTRGLNPIPTPQLPVAVASALQSLGLDPAWWENSYRPFYWLTLLILACVVWLLKNLESSRLGRAWVAVREDELAATCMGIDATRVKLSAFALGAGLAGLAGSLYATSLKQTADPDTYGFNLSILILSCVILGGLGSIRGTLLGVALLTAYDLIAAPALDSFLQRIGTSDHPLLRFTSWRLMIFGVLLIVMMRLRPEGLLPSLRMRRELHEGDARPDRRGVAT